VKKVSIDPPGTLSITTSTPTVTNNKLAIPVVFAPNTKNTTSKTNFGKRKEKTEQ